ncbi:13623_t:CDS:2 [Ambispora gerdemannii]|uniref:13623_t:CDS:1 n=1 Tax=Ambispora gerdemannii TaxID=144530 RepID=A0A9N8YUM2_9GLOM|nr:13623_t:CDS:2 [Ambispora gerdemannii]
MGNCVSNSKFQLENNALSYNTDNGKSTKFRRDCKAYLFNKKECLEFDSTSGKKNKMKKAKSKEVFRVIEGRKYHNFQDVHYFLPCDNEEIDRLTNEHFLIKCLWGRNFFSPIENLLLQGNIRILDVGCGSGTWMLEMATTFPSSFYGIDVSAIYPDTIKPQNTNFINTNILRGLPFSDSKFDYIHHRFLLHSIPDRPFKRLVLPELLRVTGFGGFLEFVEADIECINAGPLLQNLASEYAQFLGSKGITLKPIDIGDLLVKTGSIKNIRHLQHIIPMGKRAGTLGNLAAENQCRIWKSLQSVLAPFMNYTKEEYGKMVDTIFTTEINEYESCILMHR